MPQIMQRNLASVTICHRSTKYPQIMLLKWPLLVVLLACSSVSGQHSEDANFDLFTFTQTWPPTDCFVWEEESPNNSCNLPKNNEWVIHGVWPNRKGTTDPSFCNHTAIFDLGAIDSLKQQMMTKWLEVRNGSRPEDFWKHEWEKHGTCSMNLPNMNTELKYFKKGLELYDNYNMKTILDKVNILPNQKYNFRIFAAGVKKVLGKNPCVICEIDPRTNLSYLLEIRICFDKKFTLIDCDGAYQYPTNCDNEADVSYPVKPPPINLRPEVVRLRKQ